MSFFDSLSVEKEPPLRGNIGRPLIDECPHLELLEAFDYAARWSREHHIQQIHAREETFERMWNLSTSGASPFLYWLLYGTGIFWISGKLGSGKSTLVEYLANHHRIKTTLQSISSLQWTVTQFFFDFGAGDSIQNNFEGLLRPLLFQIFSKVPQLPKLQELKDPDDSDLSGRVLKHLFRTTLERSPYGICIFIDGLDEYFGNIMELIRFFRTTEKIPNTFGGEVKICLASRPEPEILASLQGIPYCSLQDHNQEGVMSYILMVLKGVVPIMYSDKWRLQTLVRTIARHSEGVFLWARFAIEEVVEGHSRGENLNELVERLEKLPKELEQKYERIFQRMSPAERKEGMIMLQIISEFSESRREFEPFDAQPFTLQYLFVAVDLAINQTEFVRRSLDDAECNLFRKRLRLRSGGLLEVVEMDGPNVWLRTDPVIEADWHKKLSPFQILPC